MRAGCEKLDMLRVGEQVSPFQAESMSTEQSPQHVAPHHIAFFDTTLRDGEQSPGCSMTTQEKLTMAHALEDLGVDIIEAGFAMASEGDFPAISPITQASARRGMPPWRRPRQEDIKFAGPPSSFADGPGFTAFS